MGGTVTGGTVTGDTVTGDTVTGDTVTGDTAADPLAARVVVLGASNVQLGLAAIVQACGEAVAGPVDLMAALGHGRSFGRPSSIPCRTLPAIIDCPLWEDLAARPAAPTCSLITDIGNDLLYGRTPHRTAAWVATCVRRLSEQGPVTLTSLPLRNLDSLTNRRYLTFRTLFFPKFRLSLGELGRRAHELNDRLVELTVSHGCRTIELPVAWYGFDPIHYRLRARRAVWRALMHQAIGRDEPNSAVVDTKQDKKTVLRFTERPKIWSAAPAKRVLCGVSRCCRQPCVRLSEGTRVSLY